MTRLIKSSFLWQFAGGFLIGAVGVGALAVSQDASAVTPAAIHATR